MASRDARPLAGLGEGVTGAGGDQGPLELPEDASTLDVSCPDGVLMLRARPHPGVPRGRAQVLLEGHGPDEPVFTAADGGDFRLTNWRRRVFDSAVRVAGVVEQKGGDVFRPHDMRHTCASLHVQAGTPIKVLYELLGHASIAITMDRYSHLYPGDAAGDVDALGAAAVESRAAWVRSEGVPRVVQLHWPVRQP